MPSNRLILCHPLLLLPSIFPSIRVFSNESVLRMRWPKYWSFSFSISPSNEYSGLISFRMDWLTSLQSKGLSKMGIIKDRNGMDLTKAEDIKKRCQEYTESEVSQSCPTLCNPVDCSPPGSSVHEILQSRILEWVFISFSRGSSRPRNRTRGSLNLS